VKRQRKSLTSLPLSPVNVPRFLAELKRRHVYRAAVAYIVASWALAQGIAQVLPVFDIPNSVIRWVIIALMIGFPAAILLSWLYEITPEGIVREEDVDPETRKTARRFCDIVIIGVLLLLIMALIYGRLPFRSSTGELSLNRMTDERLITRKSLIRARLVRMSSWMPSDSLGLQGELASQIADELRVTLSPNEKARIEAKPTENADAYLVYLQANRIERNADTLLENCKKAEQLYVKAIGLDPKFALAHARLASTRAAIFHYYEPLDSWKTKARIEAETALELQQNLAEAHLALGQCIYWLDQDYDRALAEFEITARLAPNNTEVGGLTAAIKRRQGKWQEALQGYEKISKLDPQNPNIIRNLLFTYTAMRHWPEAARVAERMRAMAPTSVVAKAQIGYVDFWWKGDTNRLKSNLAEIPTNIDPDGVVTTCRWDIAMSERDYATAKRVVDASPLNEFSYTNGGVTPKSFFYGCIALAEGDANSAGRLFDAARTTFEAAVKESPNSAERHANLGLVYALMGKKEDAIREGRRAVELKPESVDAVDGVQMNCYLALTYARCGEKDFAFPLLGRLLKTPGAPDSGNYSVTVNDLKFRWEWDPIRNDPRFQKLLCTPP